MSLQNCLLTGGYSLGCSTTGGVNQVWLGNWEEVTAFAQDSCGIITGLTTASPLTAFTFTQDIETAGLVSTGSYSRENGTVFYESVLSIKMFGLDCNVRNRLVEIGRAPLFAVIESNAGDFYFLGISSAGRANSGEANLGLALGDMNGVSLSVSFKSPDGPFLMNGSLLGTTIVVA